MVQRSVISADEHQFVLADPSGAELTGARAELPLVDFSPDTAEHVSIITGAQWGSIIVTCDALDAPPEAIDDRWQDVAELSVTCTSGLHVGELMGERPLPLCVEAGTYRVRVSASGRREAARLELDELPDVGAGEPVEEYLIQAWPAEPEVARTLRSSLDDVELSEVGEAERREAARLAGQRIRADLEFGADSRRISGSLGILGLDVVLARPIDKVWTLIANLDITKSSAPNEPAIGNEFMMSSYDRDEDGFLGAGAIVCRWTGLISPTRISMTWRWTGTRRHVAETELSVTLADLTTDPDAPRVALRLDHHRLPVEWIEDMTAIWLSKVDMWAYQSRPRKRRR